MLPSDESLKFIGEEKRFIVLIVDKLEFMEFPKSCFKGASPRDYERIVEELLLHPIIKLNWKGKEVRYKL